MYFISLNPKSFSLKPPASLNQINQLHKSSRQKATFQFENFHFSFRLITPKKNCLTLANVLQERMFRQPLAELRQRLTFSQFIFPQLNSSFFYELLIHFCHVLHFKSSGELKGPTVRRRRPSMKTVREPETSFNTRCHKLS